MGLSFWRERKKASDIFRLRIIVFFRELFRIIIDQGSVLKSLLVEIHTRDNMKRENSMEREFMFGLLEQVLRDILFKELSRDKGSGDQKLESCL